MECRVRLCSGLVTPKSAKGLCGKHYRRLLNGQDLEAPTDFDTREPIVDGDVVKIPIGTGAKDGYALVDIAFIELAELKWHLTNRDKPVGQQYVSSSVWVNGKMKEIKLHQAVMGTPPLGKVIDHIRGNRKDNRLSKLRLITKQQNIFNHIKYKNNSSGYIGVYHRKQNGRWMAKIGHNGKLLALGDYVTPEEAARARDIKAIELHGEFASLNFPRSDYEK